LVSPRSSRELVHQWVGIWGLPDTLPTRLEQPLPRNPDVWREVFESQDNHPVIVYYGIRTLGHALPVDPGEEDYQGGQTGGFSQDRDFYSTYYIARDFGLVR
jgi:poly(3-hydroxybutyrate) depolymerase